MQNDSVPLNTPDNFDELLDSMVTSPATSIGLCFLCGSAIPPGGLIEGTATHDCPAGRELEATIAAEESG